ncbi:MAG: YbgC/FadM family acyl-CoA thioesterase [Rhodospirillales bacterium]
MNNIDEYIFDRGQISESIIVRVYYEDTDAGGIVYYANYLKFAERGRTELIRSIMELQSNKQTSEKINFVVQKCNLEYDKPARLDDLIEVKTEISLVKGSVIEMLQFIISEETILVKIFIKLVCINSEGRPVRIPKYLQKSCLNLIN